ncbi:phage tail tape measure protein [Anoxybacillus ayderensis G10]|nr:phage tail tape measure protein [Anoxybacillus ayderensis G10]
MMLAMGWNAENLLPDIKAIGDAVSAVGGGTEALENVGLAFAQMSAKGKISAEEMNQLAENGIPAWQLLSQETGKSVQELMKMSENGKLFANETIPLIMRGIQEKFGGSMEKASNTFTGQLERLKEVMNKTFGTVSMPLFEALKNILPEIADKLQSVGNWFSNLSEPMKKIITATAIIVPAFTLLAGGILLAIGAIGNAISGFGALSLAIAEAGGMAGIFSSAIAAITGPIGIAVAAIAGLGVAFAVLYQKNEAFRNGVQQVWEQIKSAFSVALTYINSIVQTVMNTVSTFISAKLSEIKAFWQQNGEQIKQAAQNVWGFITKVIEATMVAISAVMKVMWPIIKALIISTWESIKGVIDGALKVILGLVKAFSSLFTGNFRGLWEGVKQIFIGAVQFIWNLINLMFIGKLLGGVKALATSLISNIGSMWTTIRSIFGASVNTVKSIVASGFNFIKNFVSNTLGTAKTIVSTTWNGIKTIFSTTVNTIKSIVTNGFNLLKNAVSKAMDGVKTAIETGWNKTKSFLQNINLKQIGKDIIQGLINGLGSMMGLVQKKISEIANSIPAWAKKILGIHSPSRVMAEVGQWTTVGFAKGIESKKKDVEKSSKKTAEAAKKAFQEAFAKAQTNFKLGKIDSSQYISELRKIQKEYAKLPEQVRKVQLEIKKVQDQRAKEQAALAKKQFEDAKKAIEDKRALNRLSLDQELKAWQALAKKYKEGSKERIEIEKEIVRVKNELLKQQFEKEKEYTDKRKYYNHLSLKEELELYENYIKKYKQGTEQREYYEREIYRVKKEINDKLLEANNEYAEKVKEINERLQQDELKAKEEYEAKVKEINDRLVEEERKLTEEYQKAVDDRTKALYSFAGIFDEINRKDDVTGQGLLKNLSDQVNAFKDWQANIVSLAARGIDDGLLQELRDMGPKAVDEIAALNSLSDVELQQYVQLWREKNALAKAQAVSELEGMRQETQLKIQQLRATANAELEQVRIEYVNKIAQLRAQAAAELEQHKIEWMAKIKEITEGTKTELNLMTASMADIGKNSMQGLIDGLNSMMGPLRQKAQEIANVVQATIKNALKIKSPSRVMRDEIGKWIPLGLAEGINRNINAVVSATNRMAQAAIPNVSSAVMPGGYGVVQTTNVSRYGNVNINVTIPISDLQQIQTVNDFFTRLGMKVKQA